MQERIIYASIISIQANYWQKFMNESFPGLTNFEMSFITFLDWKLLLFNGNYDHRTAITAMTLFWSCTDSDLKNTVCLEKFLKKEIPAIYYNLAKNLTDTMKSSNLTKGFKDIFSTLWYAKLPCYDTEEIKLSNKLIKRCKF
jgi:hypothetical protein